MNVVIYFVMIVKTNYDAHILLSFTNTETSPTSITIKEKMKSQNIFVNEIVTVFMFKQTIFTFFFFF